MVIVTGKGNGGHKIAVGLNPCSQRKGSV